MKRIAIAQPAKMHHGLFLNSLDKQFPAWPAYREFCDALKAGLEAEGFIVVDYCSMPNTAVIDAIIPVPKVSKQEADVILVPSVEIGYFAPNRLHNYTVEASGHFMLIDTATRKAIGSAFVPSPPATDPPPTKYWTSAALVADLPGAMLSLKRSGAAFGKAMAAKVK